MEKVLTVNGLIFNFQYQEEGGFWYLGKNEFDIFQLGYTTNISMDYSDVNWAELQRFLEFITSKDHSIQQKINIANLELQKYFKQCFESIEPNFKYDDLVFTLCNIEYNGIIDEGAKEVFDYVLNFNAESISDRDFFTYDSWNSVFHNETLISVNKS